jgi:hypothetical protein
MELSIRDKIEQLEAALMDHSEELNLVVGDSEMFPLKHTFVDGLYIREMEIKKDHFAIGKLQKREHLWMLLKGHLTITTLNGTEDYIGPCYIKSAGGIKRAVYAHEDSIFVNIYPNPDNEKDLDKIEDTWIAKNYLEYEKYKQLKE